MQNNDQLQSMPVALEMKSKAELREEEEKKKEKQRLAALYYFTALYLDKIEQKRMLQTMARIDKMNIFHTMEKPKRQKLMESAMLCMQYALVSKKFIDKKREFFEKDMEDSAFQNVRKSLKELNLKEDCFSVIAICAAKKYMKKFCDKIMGRALPPKDEKEIAEIKEKCTKAAAAILTGQKENMKKPLADILKEGLGLAVKQFAETKNEEEAVQWSTMAKEILYIYGQRPELVKESEITEKQLSIANRVADLGDDVRRGMMAIEVLIAAETNDKVVLSEDQRKFMLDNAFTVKSAIYEKQLLAKNWDEPVAEKDAKLEEPILKPKELEPVAKELVLKPHND